MALMPRRGGSQPQSPAIEGTEIQSPTNPLQYIVYEDIKTMDTQNNRIGLPSDRAAWLENLMPIGPDYLFTVPGPLPAIATIAGKTIYKQFYAFFGQTTITTAADYLVAFTTDGAGYTINVATGSTTLFAAASTFSNPDVAQWKSERILIADPTSGYATYDTTAFVKQGGMSPNIAVTAGGSGYASGATAASSGGTGSGDTYQVTTVGGVVTAVTLLTPGSGFLSTDSITLTITAVSGGSGATANAHVWPFVAKYQTLAVYSGRVWQAGGTGVQARTLQWTGTMGYDDFSTGNASGLSVLPDSDLVHQISALRALNNYLWIFGDNSVKQIGTVSVSGSTTVFTIVTLSSDTGTLFPQSIASYNRLLLFANRTGVYAVLGASVEKISNQMDGIFQRADYSSVNLQAALNDVGSVSTTGNGSIRCYMLLIRYVDPMQGTRSLLLTFFQNKWFLINQGSGIISMTTAVVSGSLETFVSSGSDATQIIQSPTTPVPILYQTALSPHGKPHIGKRAIRAAVMQVTGSATTMNMTVDTENSTVSTGGYSVGIAVRWLNASGAIVTWINSLSALVNFLGFGPQFQRTTAQGTGIYLGITLSGTINQWSITNTMIEYESTAPLVSMTQS